MIGENNMKKIYMCTQWSKNIYKSTFTFLVTWRAVHSSFASLSVSFGSSLLLKFFYQSELLSCKWREMKQTNISWPVTKVKETSSTGLEIYNAVRIIIAFSLSLFFFTQSWVINHANWPGEYEILKTQKRRFSQITFILIWHWASTLQF